MPIWIHGILLMGSISAAIGQICLKQGSTGRAALLEFVNAWILGGLAFYAAGTLLWIYALSKARLTLVYPYTALTFVMVYVAGALLFAEPIPGRAMVGVGFVLLGLLLINWQ